MKTRNPSLWLAIGLHLTFVTTSPGGLESADAVVRYMTAKSWLEGRAGVLPPEFAWHGGALLPDGRVYSTFGPLQSVLMLPSLAAVRLLPPLAVDPTLIETFAISLVLFPAVSTAAMLLLFYALRLLGHRPREAILAVLAIAVGSIFWHYARSGQEENLLGLGFALWLCGAARLEAGRRFPLSLMAAGAAAALATRWASVPLLAVLLLVTWMLVGRTRRRLDWRDLVLGASIVAAVTGSLLLYNWLRFGDPLQTGYGIWYAYTHEPMFTLTGYGEHLAAFLVSPYRGLLFYSPVVLAAVAGAMAARPGPSRLLAVGGVAVLAAALLFFSAFRFWTGGHSWGPRFLTAPHVLLAPALAAFFARFPRSAPLVPLLAALQIFSTALPTSTEEYVWYKRDRKQPGFCTPWRFECTPVPQRIPRALRAVANTVANRPGIVLTGRPLVPPEIVLSTSDYRTLYWWPVRIAFRRGTIPLPLALTLCTGGLAVATAALLRAWRAASGAATERASTR
jgi:hypothetical protein